VTDRRRRASGQAAVEVALVMPVVALLLLGVVQVALVVRDQVLVVHAAREAARAAAVDPSPGAARQAAVAATSLRPERLDVDVPPAGGPGRLVTATVAYRSPTAAPLIGPLLPDVVVRGRASMRREH
jgi:Flp pilus assembly protein TadG